MPTHSELMNECTDTFLKTLDYGLLEKQKTLIRERLDDSPNTMTRELLLKALVSCNELQQEERGADSPDCSAQLQVFDETNNNNREVYRKQLLADRSTRPSAMETDADIEKLIDSRYPVRGKPIPLFEQKQRLNEQLTVEHPAMDEQAITRMVEAQLPGE